MDNGSRNEGARLRRAAAAHYVPERVQLLLVDHAPPKSLERYFYFERVTEKDDLFRYVVKGLFGKFPERGNKPAWLGRLRGAGVFLIDLIEHPYDGSDLAAHIPGLLDRARPLEPDHIVLIKADVYDAVFAPMQREGLPVVDKRIYFPGSGQQKKFDSGFASALRQIGWTSDGQATTGWSADAMDWRTSCLLELPGGFGSLHESVALLVVTTQAS